MFPIYQVHFYMEMCYLYFLAHEKFLFKKLTTCNLVDLKDVLLWSLEQDLVYAALLWEE